MQSYEGSYRVRPLDFSCHMQFNATRMVIKTDEDGDNHDQVSHWKPILEGERKWKFVMEGFYIALPTLGSPVKLKWGTLGLHKGFQFQPMVVEFS